MSNLTVELTGKEREEYIRNRQIQEYCEPERLGLIRRVGESEFVNDLMRDDYAHWTVEEARALYEYYDEVSDCFENGLEIDRTMVRCEWSSYESFAEILEAYSLDSIQEIEENTQMIQLDKSILIQDF